MKTFIALALTFSFAAPLAAQEAGTTRQDAQGIEQVFVPAGCFIMGTDEAGMSWALQNLEFPSWAKRSLGFEMPARETCLTKGYWIDRTEVTNEAFAAFVADGGYDKTEFWSAEGQAWLAGQDKTALPVACIADAPGDFPRVCVTWFEAEAYAAWRGGRLPSEAEWEFAARGPDALTYPWGNDWDPAKANVVGTTAPTAVGSFPDGASWVGALDLSGNAMEWVSDWLKDGYGKDAPKDDPQGPDTGTRKVEKGGWWGSNAWSARSAYKHFEDPPEYQDHHIGFRIVTPVE